MDGSVGATPSLEVSSQLGFNRALRAEVSQRLRELGKSRAGGAPMLWKLGVLSANFLGCYWLTLTLSARHLAFAGVATFFQAIALVLLMLGVMHDGSHSSFSESPWLNRLAKWLLVVAGGSAISWHHEHVVRHHSHTNVLGLDSDLESGGLLRFHPGQPWRKIHRYQRFYAWFLYALVSFKWTWFEDLDDVFHNRYALPARARAVHALEVFLAKLSQVSLFLVIPSQFFGFGRALGLYFLHFVVVSVAMAVTFVLAHLSSTQELPQTRSHAPRDWAEFQLATTANFATGNRALTWALGGLNYQIEHHLFPHVSQRHYPMIREIVRRQAAERGLRYREFTSLWGAIRGHVEQLRRLGER